MCILLIDPVIVFFIYFERKLSYLAEQHIFLKKKYVTILMKHMEQHECTP